MQHRLRPLLIIALLAPLGGCAGFGDYMAYTADPFHRPHQVTVTAENGARAYGKNASSADLAPEAGQPWPTSYPVDPTIMEIAKQDKAVQ